MDRVGKEGPEFMERVVYHSLGSHSRKMKFGPQRGLDNGVISLGRGRVMILTVDPVSVVPAFGMKLSAWLSVHLIASDYTTSGHNPEFATFSYNFPPHMEPSEREEYIRAVGAECKVLGVSIAGGHTGSYPGGGFTVIGSGSMFGFANEGRYVTPSMAEEGDSLLMTKHAAIEATGSLARIFPQYTESRVGTSLAKLASSTLGLCSTVKDAEAARQIGIGSGGVTSMHDATEGGILGGLEEMAAASRKAFMVKVEQIPVSEDAREVCAAFSLDPLATMGEGALLITCGHGTTSELERRLSRRGIAVKVIGTVEKGDGLHVVNGRGRVRMFTPRFDRYWAAYAKAVALGLE